MSLTTLPILPLEIVVSYLDFSSLVSLANSTASLAYLQPKEQHVIREDYSIEGRAASNPSNPSNYFDVKVETRGLLGIKLVWQWKGWRPCNRSRPKPECLSVSGPVRGQLCLQLVREDKVLEENLYKALAPEDKWQNQEVLLEQHPVISKAQRGDLIRVVIYLEGRHGRHGLHVRAFKMTLLLKNPSSEKEEEEKLGNCIC